MAQNHSRVLIVRVEGAKVSGKFLHAFYLFMMQISPSFFPSTWIIQCYISVSELCSSTRTHLYLVIQIWLKLLTDKCSAFDLFDFNLYTMTNWTILRSSLFDKVFYTILLLYNKNQLQSFDLSISLVIDHLL